MKDMNRRNAIGVLSTAVAGTLGLTTTTNLFAQDKWPSKSITIVVGYPAGGDTDTLARVMGEQLQSRLGQSVIVLNKPGASGIIGAHQVFTAKPDGYTLLMAPSTVAMAQLVVKTSANTRYDLSAMTPIIQMCWQPMFLAVNASAGFNTVEEVVAASKQKRLNYSSPGIGSPMHILGTMFNDASGAQLAHVPYKGVAPAVTDLAGGQVPFSWMTYGPLEPYVKDQRVKILAVAQPERSVLTPDVPTLKELGYPDVDVVAWNGLYGPPGLPADIVATLNTELNEVLKLSGFDDRLASMGMVSAGGAAEVLGQTAGNDERRFTSVVKSLGL